MNNSLSDAKQTADSKSSPLPSANFDKELAEQGATIITSHHLANYIWPIAASASVLNRSVCTFSPERACIVRGVMNS